MADIVSLSVPESTIKDIVKAQISNAIIQSMDDGGDRLVKEIVDRTLTQKVNDRGEPSTYSSDKDRTYLDYVCAKIIREATDQAMRQWCVNNVGKIEKAIDTHMSKSTSKIAKSVADSLMQTAKCPWRIKIEVEGSDR